MLKKIGIGLAAVGTAAAATGVYLRFIRPWQLRWGATDEEVARAMPGDEVVKHPTFNATRAVTIQARPEQIWPWLVQMGIKRAGWYSYDWLDNLGIPSAERIVPELQQLAVGDLIPMSPDGKQGQWVKDFEPNQWMLWWDNKGNATWSWGLYTLEESQTRLITRVRMRYHWLSPMLVFDLLVEFTDIVMMRKCMLGIMQRAEHASGQIPERDQATIKARLKRAERGSLGPIRATARTAIFFLKILPMLPSRPVDWVTKPPVMEKVKYPTRLGQTEGELYRPSTGGPHPGVIVCLGVVPFGVDHPQLPHLEEALARAGFAALIYWSPVMRDLRLDPEDIENIALAYQWLLEQPYVDPARSGLIGTCVGGSFALMAAASPLIRDSVAFVGAFAPYASMWTFAQDIASATRIRGEVREPWQVDQLTRKVYVRTLTSLLEPGEAERLRNVFTDQGGQIDNSILSEEGQALYPLLTALGADDAERALHRLPPAMQEYLTALSPLSYLRDIHAPLIVFGDDRDDLVIPVSESRHLWSALSGRAGVHYTEFAMFQHLDPTKRKLPLFQFVQQLGKFFLYVYPMFRQAVTA